MSNMLSMVPYVGTGLSLGAGLGIGPQVSPGLGGLGGFGGFGGVGAMPSTGDPVIDQLSQQVQQGARQQAIMGMQMSLLNQQTAMQQLAISRANTVAQAGENDEGAAKQLSDSVKV